MTRRDYFQILSAGAAMAGAVQVASAAAGDADRERRMKWWHEARFGMFIHWGLYSTLGRHEWAMENEAIPVAEYQQLAKTFEWRNRFPFPIKGLFLSSNKGHLLPRADSKHY